MRASSSVITDGEATGRLGRRCPRPGDARSRPHWRSLREMTRRLLTVALLACALGAAVPATASASKLVTRDATSVSLKVDRFGRALVTYKTGGVWHHTLMWGAINAKYPDRAHPKSQVKFRTDYSGGSGVFHREYWKTMVNVCGPYTGPALHSVVKACTMPDGSHWVLQSWRRLMPNSGFACCRSWEQGRVELHLSHFKGPIAQLWLKWTWTRRLTWQGKHLDSLLRPAELQGPRRLRLLGRPAPAAPPTASASWSTWTRSTPRGAAAGGGSTAS